MLCCYNKICESGYFIQNRDLFLIILQAVKFEFDSPAFSKICGAASFPDDGRARVHMCVTED
jgi:hypothetical protein